MVQHAFPRNDCRVSGDTHNKVLWRDLAIQSVLGQFSGLQGQFSNSDRYGLGGNGLNWVGWLQEQQVSEWGIRNGSWDSSQDKERK